VTIDVVKKQIFRWLENNPLDITLPAKLANRLSSYEIMCAKMC